MNKNQPASLCRTCLNREENGARCRVCGSARMIRHPELDTLSIAHVDCDAFFAAVEKRDNPALKELPVIVGGGKRGVVSTCCYIARAFGIRSAMPMFKALKLCPNAVVVPPRFSAYKAASQQISTAMAALTPLVQPVSIDEAFLDLSGTERLHTLSPAAVLARLAHSIEAEVGISVSIGLSHNKFLAKLASDLDKPRGFSVIGRAETISVLAPMSPRAIYGVGARFAEKLKRDGITQLSQLQTADPKTLIRRYGDYGLTLHHLSRGEDTRRVTPERTTKTISGETTFSDDITSLTGLKDRLYAMTQKVASRAKEKNLAGRVVTIKLKTTNFKTKTRRITLSHPTNLAHVIFETAQNLLRAEEPNDQTKLPYRLIGVGISDLSANNIPAGESLFPDPYLREGKRESAVDSLRAKFGDDVIGTMRDIRTKR